jgi:hypothetical protein
MRFTREVVPSMKPSDQKKQPSIPPDWLVVVILVEAAALVIALLMPITPSKTGSSWNLAEMFLSEPTYLEEVAAGFLATNVLVVVLGLIVWISVKLKN